MVQTNSKGERNKRKTKTLKESNDPDYKFKRRDRALQPPKDGRVICFDEDLLR